MIDGQHHILEDFMYSVQGGIYTNTDFSEVIPGTEEIYGPFETMEEAREYWSARARANIDDCHHRLTIKVSG